MHLRRTLYLIGVLLSVVSHQGISQYYTPIEGTINKYTSIESILCFEENDLDSVIVADLNGFNVGDTVMIYVVQGAAIVTETSTGFPDFDQIGGDSLNPGNTGRYAFLIINDIYAPGKVVVFNNRISPHFRPMRAGETAQLIRVPSYRNAEVTVNKLLAQPWDGAKGGVITLFVNVLILKGDIDASETGFRGASENRDYLYGCTSVNPDELDSLFYQIDHYSAGKKGEGTTNTLFDRLRGRAKNINGGGGGNGLFSGGGGGSNYSGGGSGGNESSQCAQGISDPGGQGGFFYASASYYKNYYNDLDIGFDRYDRIFFGGGGGTGTRKPGINPSDGGNGGGVVVIVADSIIGNGHWIRADGKNALSAAGAAGGGGGGGCILLDVNGYRTQLNLSATGGDGGNTTGADTTGPGGGGGGGIYWLSGGFGDHPQIAPSPDRGLAGKYKSIQSYGAANGGTPFSKYGLFTPIRGFVFNPVPNEFTVCSDMVPPPLLASEPRGGDGPESGYGYLWVDSSATQNAWLEAPGGPGVVDQQNYYFPGPLADTTYFRRIVYSGALPPDTSFRIAVYVHPEVTGNTISAPDTVCSGLAPKNKFEPTATIGGGPTGGTFTYTWKQDEGSGFINAGGDFTKSSYQALALTTTTDFVRIVKAGACVDTSNALNLKVWENHTTFQIENNDTVCYNTEQPDLLSSLNGVPPGEGDQGDIRYQWITSADGLNWSDISGATAGSYQPPVQTQTAYFSRIVRSGSDDACVDTSNYAEILNISLIESNTISDTRTVCTGSEGGLMTGSDPSGGFDNVQFSYRWEAQSKATGWVQVKGPSFAKIDYDPGIMNGDTTWYRRVVGAGGADRNVCISFSNVDTIHVLPPITNNLITTSDSVLCEDDSLEYLVQNILDGSTPIGGDASWRYQWQMSAGKDVPGSWGDLEGATEIDFREKPKMVSDDDRWFRRLAYSGPADECQQFSNLVHVTIHTGITNNAIDPVDSVCFSTAKEVQGVAALGEEGLAPAYLWRDAATGTNLPGPYGQNYSYAFNLQQAYQFEREARIGECIDTSNRMEITVMQLPGGILSGDIPRACETDVLLALDLNVDALESFITPWEVRLYDGVNPVLSEPYVVNGDGAVEVALNTNEDSTQFTYTIGQIVYRSVTGRYECVAPPGNMTGSVPIHVFRTPEPEIRVDGEARETFKVCNTTVSLTANSDKGEGRWIFKPSQYISASKTSGEGYLISIPDSKEAYGIYKATYASVAGVCEGTDSIDLYFFEQPEAAYAGEDTLLFLINTVELKADPPTAGTGTWTVEPRGPVIEDIHEANTFAHELGLGVENYFTWTIINGEDEGTCESRSAVRIVVRTEVKRYNGFSPNGDLDNEYYIMQGLKYADEFTVTFFNSLGSTVRTVTEKNAGEIEVDPGLINNGLREDEMVVWDGKSDNGNLVPSGTYYYVVNYIMFQRDYETGNITRKDSYEYSDYIVVLRD